ncbi:prepilin-type cleavage/methylation domain-containing protein [Synechococcus sp. EJ6-Ellesmere]|uniref:prepilin-type cleavage/methylation domain-containing protein n=1 Tax=Synechococcus sp. EJ6-Ellesmere TaxID=2823734 RepID=UPI0020CD16B8|nr:prepilin-type cleavage/methylation domain-containing protein [Synechococcus sp. EJ6-Ellesmere]MCP9824422.1 prepilin-type cleavage/methylation domain-containing protein [Synechococcus sp. EJ6-Ellesmere]
MMLRVQTTRRQASAGFGLVELLLAMALGLMLCGVVVQALLGEGRNAQQFSRLVRERNHQRRALALIRTDLEGATEVVNEAAPLPVSCGVAGRQVVLQLKRQGTVISYSVGAPPSGIWRGQVLMRCGPAYGLEGRIDPSSASLSRVVVDGLASDPSRWTGCGHLPGATALNGSMGLPFSACLDPASQLVAMRLEQSFADGGGPVQRVRSEAVAGAG